MTEIGSFAALRGRIGEEIAVSDWLTVSQERIQAFADATDDNQWIHVDTARAAASPLKTTVAHGFLTLSLVSTLLRRTVKFPPLRMAINYGSNRVRFITPVPSGARIRARISVAAVDAVADTTGTGTAGADTARAGAAGVDTARAGTAGADTARAGAAGASQVTWAVTVELESALRPCAVVEWVVRYYPEAESERRGNGE